MQQSTTFRPRRKAAKPDKPRADFPLYPHGSGKWAKTIRGKTHYFGKWDNPQGALDEYLNVKDDLHAGRTPRSGGGGPTVRDICNAFMRSKRTDMDAAMLSPRTFVDYDRVCKRLVDEFGASRVATDVRPTDFEQLYGKLARKLSVTSLGGEITMTRSVFKYAYESDLIDRPVKFGPKFKCPSKADRRKAKARNKAANGKRMLEAAEIRALLKAASPPLKAMVLLGINGGLGNTDCATLPLGALDLDAGWLDFARAKTGVERRIPLWPETVAALREAIAQRKTPGDPDDADIVFVTKYRQRWVRYEVVEVKKFGKVEIKPKQDDAIAKATAKLLKQLDIKRPGIGFYALRHSFETIGGGSRDQVAVDAIMGHIDGTMAAEYRDHIDDARLQAVVDHVHGWLYAGANDGQEGGSDG